MKQLTVELSLPDEVYEQLERIIRSGHGRMEDVTVSCRLGSDGVLAALIVNEVGRIWTDGTPDKMMEEEIKRIGVRNGKTTNPS